MTRQAMNAIEAGHDVPSTLVAMPLAKPFGCRVEDLFQLTDAPRQLEAEWLGEASTADVDRPRIQLACVGSRLLARPDITLVKREPGAGSRTLLDLWLQGAGVTPAHVHGYRHEVSSHREVADAVARGQSDTEPGIMAVARALGLDFLPLQDERDGLVIPQEFLNAPAVQTMLDVVVSRPFLEELDTLGGYDSSRAGRWWQSWPRKLISEKNAPDARRDHAQAARHHPSPITCLNTDTCDVFIL
jgi:DNA-binding XRE family transcriptional regulator